MNFFFKKPDYLTLAAVLFFIIFALYTVFDAQARILISDPALYLFKIIVSKNFFIPAERLTSVINQPLLVLAVHAKIPLKYLIVIYSVSFVLVRFLYYWLAAHVFKCRSAGYAVIFVSIVGVAESYFRPTSESTIALLNSILLYAWLYFANQEKYHEKLTGQLIIVLVALVFVLLGYYSHPMALFSLVFAIGYHAIKEKKLASPYPWLILLVTAAIFLSKVLLTGESTHHGGLYGNLFTNPVTIFNELPGYYPYNYFWGRKDTLFLPLLILSGASLLALLFRKKWFLSGFYVLYMIFYFVVTCVSFKQGESNMQMEKLFLPLVFFAGIIFMDFFILRVKNALVTLLPLLFFMVYGFLQIHKARPVYRGRIDYLKEITAAAAHEEHRKLVLPADSVNNSRMLFNWASGIETLMLSTMDKNMKPLTVHISVNPGKLEEQMNNNRNYICAPFHSYWSYDNLNPDYFKLPEEKYYYFRKDFK